MLDPCARELEAKTERCFGEKAYFWPRPDSCLRESTWSGERARFLERLQREVGALDGRMMARAPASQLIKASTTMDLGTKVSLSLYDVTSEKKRGFG